ncbi:hypothetical protein XPA_009043 [Xanthoria parietina]
MMTVSPCLCTFISWSLLFISQCHAISCYFPNGTSADVIDGKRIQQPCNEGVQSMCCMLQNSQTPETCTADGLCRTYDNTVLARGTCTDPTWKDPACLDLCLSGEKPDGKMYEDTTTALTVCADGSICCERPNVTCCSGRKGVFVQGGKVVSSLASSASYTSTSVSSTPTVASGQGSSSSGEIATPAVPSPTPALSNPGPIVGGVVGGVAAIAVLSLAFWYFFIRHRYTRQQGIPQDNVMPYTGMAQDGYHGIARMGGNGIWQEPKEVPDAEVRRELDSNQRQELDARFGGM